MDISLAEHAPHVAAHVAACKPVVHTVTQIHNIGVHVMTAIISTGVALLAGFGIGWYVKGRGWFGVTMDASNAVKEVKTVATTATSDVEAAVAPKSN